MRVHQREREMARLHRPRAPLSRRCVCVCYGTRATPPLSLYTPAAGEQPSRVY